MLRQLHKSRDWPLSSRESHDKLGILFLRITQAFQMNVVIIRSCTALNVMSSLSQDSHVCLRHCWIGMVKWCLFVYTVSMVWFPATFQHGPPWIPCVGGLGWANMASLWLLSVSFVGLVPCRGVPTWAWELFELTESDVPKSPWPDLWLSVNQSTKSSCILVCVSSDSSLKRQPCREGWRWSKTQFYQISHPLPNLKAAMTAMTLNIFRQSRSARATSPLLQRELQRASTAQQVLTIVGGLAELHLKCRPFGHGWFNGQWTVF